MAMRAILFRGKEVETGKWVYGYVCKINGHTCIIEGDAQVDDNSSYDIHTVDPITVGQWTGLFDASFKKIFEDDILQNIVTEERIRANFCCCYLNPLYYEVVDNVYDNTSIEAI